MTSNPYDFYRERQPMLGPTPANPPKPLALAVTLMHVGAAFAMLGILAAFLMRDQMREVARESLARSGTTGVDVEAVVDLAVSVTVVAGLVSAAIWTWMARANRAGKSWARIVATVLGCIAVVSTLGAFTAPTTTPANLALSAVNIALAVVILVLLWRAESSAYYRARSRGY